MRIKPFYVYRPTREEAIEIVERAHSNGANLCHGVDGMPRYRDVGYYDYNADNSWGVDDDGDIVNMPSDIMSKCAEHLTMTEVRKMLPCEKYDTVKAVEWNGEGLPPVGTRLIYSISDNSNKEVTVTANCKFGITVFDNYRNNESYHNWVAEGHRFSPVRTKREKWIDKAAIEAHKEGLVTTSAAREIAERIYDAGLAKDDEE